MWESRNRAEAARGLFDAPLSQVHWRSPEVLAAGEPHSVPSICVTVR